MSSAKIVVTRPTGPVYPYRDRTIRVTRCGRICVGKLKVNLSTVFAGQLVGIREVEDQVWLVSFLDYDSGFFDKERGPVEPAPSKARSADGRTEFEAAQLPFKSVRTGQSVNSVSGRNKV